MGILGQYAHPRMVRALRLVSEAAAANGKWSGVITGNAGLIRQCRELGMTCFSAGSELNMLASGGKKTMEMLRQQTARVKPSSWPRAGALRHWTTTRRW